MNSHKSTHLVSLAEMTVVPLPKANNEHVIREWTKNSSSPLTEHAIRNTLSEIVRGSHSTRQNMRTPEVLSCAKMTKLSLAGEI